MKVVLLAGGFGTRISEESQFKPKPMIEIGGKPILWHIMKEYSYYGFNEFIICAGYMQHVIKEWFADYFLHNNDITFDLSGLAIYARGVKFDGRTLIPFTNNTHGLVPAPNSDTETRFLREDGSWQEIVKVPQSENSDTVNGYKIEVVSNPGSDPNTIYFVL